MDLAKISIWALVNGITIEVSGVDLPMLDHTDLHGQSVNRNLTIVMVISREFLSSDLASRKSLPSVQFEYWTLHRIRNGLISFKAPLWHFGPSWGRLFSRKVTFQAN